MDNILSKDKYYVGYNSIDGTIIVASGNDKNKVIEKARETISNDGSYDIGDSVYILELKDTLRIKCTLVDK